MSRYLTEEFERRYREKYGGNGKDEASEEINEVEEESVIEVITGKKLLEEAGEIEEIIEGILGKREWMIIAGYPKHGKTFGMLQMAEALGSGKPFLDTFPCKRCRALFLSLEEGKEGIASKLRALGMKEPPIDFIFPSSLLSLPMLKDIASGYDVLFVDNLERAWLALRDRRMPSYEKGNAYEVEYDRLALWKQAFSDLPISVVISHHLNKQGLYLGTTAIKGFADVFIEMTPQRKEGNKQAYIVKIEARNRKEMDLRILREGARWEYGGELQDAKKEKAKVLIIDLLEEERREWRRAEIVKAFREAGISEEEISDDVIDNALRELKEQGSLKQPKKGVYVRPSIIDIHAFNEEKKTERKLEGME
jgi:hypothetical protein